jgi:hypothetical protein
MPREFPYIPSLKMKTVSIALCVMKAFLDTIINMSLNFIHNYVIQDWITKSVFGVYFVLVF